MSNKRNVYEKYSNGPHGIGDPEDLSLRKVELEVMIPKKMREKARVEKCSKEVENFGECCISNGILLVVKCREQNAIMRECLTKWYNDEGFKEICKKEYLEERSEYRRTGVTLKQKQRLASSM